MDCSSTHQTCSQIGISLLLVSQKILYIFLDTFWAWIIGCKGKGKTKYSFVKCLRHNKFVVFDSSLNSQLIHSTKNRFLLLLNYAYSYSESPGIFTLLIRTKTPSDLYSPEDLHTVIYTAWGQYSYIEIKY